ncbi:hypothetical protein DY000_02061231 [Brassica cretica]|uniref:GS catalytic domain-containing protein n=1 Tax=Brassica cretica TaxID=69181 RepID=A0ABQ7B3V8_BRACR|nr:hypothetical protein DY000_02061231 [Brassica cretica]
MESSLFIQSPSSFSSLFTSKSKPFPSPKPRFVSIKASIEKPKPKPKSETTSWVSPDWLTSLTRTISSGQNDDSGIPIASAKLDDVSELLGGALFLPLYKWMNEYGPIYRLAAGPRNFVVVSDPAIAKHVLRNYPKYAKGLVAEVSEFLFGSGFAIAEGPLWTLVLGLVRFGFRTENRFLGLVLARRRAVVPSLHKRYLSVIVERVFCRCAERLVEKLQPYAMEGKAVNMEEKFSQLTLDVIGLSLFNYNFDSLTTDSPVIEAVYTALKEAELRSTDILPYWKAIPRQVKAEKAVTLIRETVEDLIAKCKEIVEREGERINDEEYVNESDPSILRFLLASREEVSSVQLRDDLLSMLVAGHETTGSVLTWTLYLLSKSPSALAKAQEEVDRVLAGRNPAYEDIKELKYITRCINESMRLYPHPPVLIRRAQVPDILPGNYKVNTGQDIMISVYNVHRSSAVWEKAEEFLPERFELEGPIPNETNTDFKFIPFSGGPRKCVGDQFALMEAIVALAVFLQHLNVELVPDQTISMTTGATIHTTNGLYMKVSQRMEFKELKKAIDQVELVDAHAHNIVSLDSSFPFIRTFSEATGDALSFAPHSLSFKRNLREVAQLYGTEVSLEAIEKHRQTLGLHSLTTKCFNEARISALLIDDGLKLDKKHDTEWHRNFVPYVGRVLRIETLAEQILDEESPDDSSWTLDSFTKAFIVALKTIAAYRSGLDIDTHVSKEVVESGLVEVLQAGKPVRIGNKGLIDYILTLSLEVAERCDLPLQIHTGFGDKDLDLRLSNPLHLRTLLEDKRFAKCRIVLLHASYPFSKEASYLSSVYPQVFLDFGLAVPKLSVHGMVSSVKELLHLAPTKKVMFSTDGYATPETYYLGAKKAREVIFLVLRDACVSGDLSLMEAIDAAKDILSRNAIAFYKIDVDTSSSIPQSRISPKSQMEEPHAQEDSSSFVRVIWVDTSGQQRCRVVQAQRFNRSVKKNGIGLTHASMGMTSFYDGPAEESKLTGIGEIRLVPDLSTKRIIPWTKQESMVLADMLLKPGEAWEYCPRETLRRVTNVLKDEFDLVMNAGFENEFYLLKNVVRYAFHAESGKGQFEVSLGHTIAFHAADNLVYTREVIRSVARKHGLLATFVPKYDLCDIGSGSHVHISLWKNGENVFPASDKSSAHGMSSIGEEFMAGVLFHLPSIFAVLAPLPNSYDRIQPNTFSGAFQCWGKENREAAIRTASPPGAPDGLVTNFEIKACDGSTNPHLSLAIIMAAGIDGLRRHLQLPDPIDTNPADVAATLNRLPETLSEAVEALEKDKVLHELLGQNLLAAITGVRKAEVQYYSKNPDACKQLIHRY